MRMLVKTHHEEGRVELVRAARATRTPLPGALRPPRLSAGDLGTIEPGAAELVVSALAPDGSVLRQGAHSHAAYAFVDRDGPVNAQLAGGITRLKQDVRLIDMPLPEQAAFVGFDWHHVRKDGAARRLVSTNLGRFALGQEGGAVEATPLKLSEPVTMDRMRAIPGGRLLGEPERLHGGGDPASSFDIVILCDGFQEGELRMCRERAEVLTKGLLKIEPFKRFAHKINIHLLLAASNDSGVDNCPHPNVQKDTYYNIEGNFEGVGYAGYFGTHTYDRIHDAVELVAPGDDVELVIMLVNSAIDGGRTDRANRTVYVPIVADDESFINTVAHEAGHAVGGLTDEYLGVAKPPEGVDFPNLATEQQRIDGTVPWRGDAYPFELEGGRFRAVHMVGDPVDPATGFPIMKPGLDKMLGLFWGCSFVHPAPKLGLDNEGDAYLDPRGGNRFRPMARCKMRWTKEPFCRVCERAVASAIEAACSRQRLDRR